jgi:hypothetical protein
MVHYDDGRWQLRQRIGKGPSLGLDDSSEEGRQMAPEQHTRGSRRVFTSLNAGLCGSRWLRQKSR